MAAYNVVLIFLILLSFWTCVLLFLHNWGLSYKLNEYLSCASLRFQLKLIYLLFNTSPGIDVICATCFMHKIMIVNAYKSYLCQVANRLVARV
jgi:hypothetical protein